MTKVFILTISQLEATPAMITSSYRTPRHERKAEYYASKAGAEKRRDEIYSGMKSLVGFIDGVEVSIVEKDVFP